MCKNNTKIIVTLGPATNTEQDMRRIKNKGVDFVRVNMSHSSLEDLEYSMNLALKVGVPFIIDTEGSQIRSGDHQRDTIRLFENDEVTLHADYAARGRTQLCLRPAYVIGQLEVGDVIYLDFDTLVVRVTDISTASEGYITGRTIGGGQLGRNKAVVVDCAFERRFQLPALSPKDYQSIELGLQAGIDHIAVSFVRSRAAVEEVRRVTHNRMKIISKIECVDGLERIDEIIESSDFLLIDRGDLSKEIPIEKIPFVQKLIIHKARRHNTGVFVATNLLETMIESRRPTRAEVHDVIETIVDGAAGLTLAAETAIGKHPMECINVLNRLIRHAEGIVNGNATAARENAILAGLESTAYLTDHRTSSLVDPHGGKLVNRVLANPPERAYLESLPKITLNQNAQIDVEHICVGTYSPLEGFMGREDLRSVLERMRLANGVIWPLPIILDVPKQTADQLSIGQVVALTDQAGAVMALLHLREKYCFDKKNAIRRMFGTERSDHPGVRRVNRMEPWLLAGPVDLIRCRRSETREFELTPRQLRRLFEDRGWARVLAFHTLDVPDTGHQEFLLRTMEDHNCDGILLHPVVAGRRRNASNGAGSVRKYEHVVSRVYPKGKAVFAAFATFSRSAGTRDTLFATVCRKNYGCSHFVDGQDRSGGACSDADDDCCASERGFDAFPDLGVEIVRLNYGARLTEANGAFAEGATYEGVKPAPIACGE